jgi:hypothetical protein
MMMPTLARREVCDAQRHADYTARVRVIGDLMRDRRRGTT